MISSDLRNRPARSTFSRGPRASASWSASTFTRMWTSEPSARSDAAASSRSKDPSPPDWSAMLTLRTLPPRSGVASGGRPLGPGPEQHYAGRPRRRERQAVVIRFGILGTVEVEGESGPIVIRGARRRALLVRLLLSANQPVPADRIAEDVWDGNPPKGACLHPDQSRVPAPPTARDRPDQQPGRAATPCGSSRASSTSPTSSPMCTRATPPSSGATHWRRPTAPTRPRPVAGAGPRRRRGGGLGPGRHRPARRAPAHRRGVPAGGGHGPRAPPRGGARRRSAVEAEPLREQRWATLMLALYRSGRQADALRAFQQLRRQLDDELGLEPSPGPPGARGVDRPAPSRARLDALGHPARADRDGRPPTWRRRAPVVVLVAELSGRPRPRRTPEGAGPGGRDLVRDAFVRHGGRELSVPDRRGGRRLPQSVRGPGRGHRHAAGPGPGTGTGATSTPVVRSVWPPASCTVVDGVHRGGVVDEATALVPGRRAGGDPAVRAAGGAGRPTRSGATSPGRAPVAVDGREATPSSLLDWEPLPEEPVDLPMPEALHYPYAEYVGREAELDQLAVAFERAVGGERQVVMVGRRAGHRQDRPHRRGGPGRWRPPAERCSTGGASTSGAPYQPFVDALGHYVQFAPRHELEAHVAAYGGELDPPGPGPGPPGARGAAAVRLRPRHRALPGLHRGGRPASPRPAPTARCCWSSTTCTGPTGPPSPCCVSWSRPPPVARCSWSGPSGRARWRPTIPLSDALAALWREPGVSRLDLAGLTFDDVLDLCVAMAGHRVDDLAFVTDLQRDTGGNPFFVRELLRHLVEAGALRPGRRHRALVGRPVASPVRAPLQPPRGHRRARPPPRARRNSPAVPGRGDRGAVRAVGTGSGGRVGRGRAPRPAGGGRALGAPRTRWATGAPSPSPTP